MEDAFSNNNAPTNDNQQQQNGYSQQNYPNQQNGYQPQNNYQQQNSYQGNNNGQQYNNNRSNNSYNNNRGSNSGNFGNQGNNYRNNSGSYGKQGNNKGNFYRKQEEDQGETTLYKVYVGTGNLETPPNILDKMRSLVVELEQFGYTTRTGGMNGPDEVFESASKNIELVLPWQGFNDKQAKNYFNTKQSMDIARMFHPTFDGLKPAIQAFLAKNARMVLGKDLKSPAMFVICWSEDGAETSREKTAKTGNVGHVIAIANAMRIPVFNFGKHDAEQRLRNYLELTNVNNEQFNGNNNGSNQPSSNGASDFPDSF